MCFKYSDRNQNFELSYITIFNKYCQVEVLSLRVLTVFVLYSVFMHYLSQAPINGSRVLLRLDLDLPKNQKGFDTTRLDQGLVTLHTLLSKGAMHVTILAHRGRPKGKSSTYSLGPIEKLLRAALSPEENERVTLLPNVRFDPREEKGSIVYARTLAKKQDIFVQDAFATLHREHTSITYIPQVLPTFPGKQLEKELQAFERLFREPKRPFFVILGGAKLETKMPLIHAFQDIADVIFVGGKLALEAREKGLVRERKVIFAELTKDGKDISPEATEQCLRFIASSGTILWNGPMGLFEDGIHAKGTKAVAQAINAAKAFTFTGGGDTESAQTKYKAQDHINHLCSGGGAMLEYITQKSLPGIEAIKQSQEKFL